MVLQTIREKTSGILAIFVLVLLAIPFAFVGVNSYFESNSGNVVARVNDLEINFNDFNQSFLSYRRQMQSMMGASFNPELYDTPIARREHLDRMIDETVLENAARDLNLEVDNEQLADRIAAIPAFQVDGVFNMDVYQARLVAQGYSVPQFENEMRTSIIMAQLPGSVRESSFATDSELDLFVNLYDQKRTFSAVVVPLDVEAVTTEFSEELIAGHYEDHQGEFMTQEQVIVQTLVISAADLGPFEPLSEEALLAVFEEQKGRFLSPERRQVSHILFEVASDADEATRETVRQEAADISNRVRDGEEFAALAAEYSDDLGSAAGGGDLGWVEPGVMVESFENAMYELTLTNPVSDPVQTGFGWHVIMLTELQASEGQEFSEARETLIAEHDEEEAERAYLDLADRVVDIVYEDPTTLEAAALDSGLEVVSVGPFTRTGGEGMASNPEFVREAFSDLVLLQGSVSDPVDLGPNEMVLMLLEEHLPVALRPLEEVQDDINLALRETAALAAAEERAAAFMLIAEADERSLAEVAVENDLLAVEIEAGSRTHPIPDQEVVANVFKLNTPADGETVASVVPAINGYAYVNLREVIPGMGEDDALIARQQYRRQLANANSIVESRALVEQLRAAADVEVFEDNLAVSR